MQLRKISVSVTLVLLLAVFLGVFSVTAQDV